MRNFVLALSSATMLSQAVFAEELTYQVQQKSQNMVKFSIPYTFGIHDGTVRALRGIVHTTDQDEVLEARFQVAINDMSTGNSVRDCHMREALGIDYTQSRFPEEHVCDGSKLPVVGPDSVKYPSILVEMVTMRSTEPFVLGVPKAFAMSFNVKIHGVTRVYNSESVMITKMVDHNGSPYFKVATQLKLSLKHYNVKVKAAAVGPISINVKDEVSVAINATLVKM